MTPEQRGIEDAERIAAFTSELHKHPLLLHISKGEVIAAYAQGLGSAPKTKMVLVPHSEKGEQP